MDAAETLAPDVGTAAACRAMGVARATVYRRRRPAAPRDSNPSSVAMREEARPQPRALNHQERQVVLDALHSPRFVDKAPAAVWAALLDEGTYHCSIRTMYRILRDHDEVRERRNRPRVLRAVRPMVQPRALSLGHRPAHAGHGALRPGAGDPCRAAEDAGRGLHGASRAVRAQATGAVEVARGRLDQSAAHQGFAWALRRGE
jgi:hypothetical protein